VQLRTDLHDQILCRQRVQSSQFLEQIRCQHTGSTTELQDIAAIEPAQHLTCLAGQTLGEQG
jgi:hypothetical protein